VPPETKFKGNGSIAAQDPFKQCMGTKLMSISDLESGGLGFNQCTLSSSRHYYISENFVHKI